MTLESQQPTEEQAPKLPYLEGAQKVLKSIKSLEQDETTALRALTTMSDYLDDVLDAAENGEITRSDEQALPYTRSEIIDQFERLTEALNTKPEMTAFDLIPKSGGLRRALADLLTQAPTGKVTMDALQAKVDEHRKNEREVSLTEEEVDEIGAEALEAAGVVEPEASHGEPLSDARRAAEGFINGSSASEAAPKESDLEMNRRWVSETKKELDQLYEELRSSTPGSRRSGQLENLIKMTKEDLGGYARTVARLEGNTKWH